MANFGMIATDLDGTLIGSANELPLYTDYRDRIRRFREKRQCYWVICTGRSLTSFRQFFSPMRMMELMPDFIIIHHAYIYRLTPMGYVPHILWNLRIRYLIWGTQLSVRDAIDEWHEMVTGAALGVSTIRRKKDRLSLRFDSEESAAVATEMLTEKVKPYRNLQVFRYTREVDVRAVPFTKGLAISELARHLGIPSSDILTIGNGHNDISMLNTQVAGMTGCPSNSEEEVIAAVHKAGGHIASRRSLAGVLEILDAYRDGTVRSELPAGWKHPAREVIPPSRHSDRRRKRRHHALRFSLLAAIVYVVLLVFANFGLIPLVSGLIKKPYDLLLALLQKLLLLF